MYNHIVEVVLNFLGGNTPIEMQIANICATLGVLVAIAVPVLCIWFFVRYIFKITWR